MFTKSESIQNLAAALGKAQAEFPAVPFNAVNPFLKNRYADLGAVIETARPVLAKYGLSFTQLVTSEGENIGVITMLMHNSGEYIGEIVTLPMGEERGKSMAQVAGSVITYLRRYALASMLGLYADEDSDGQPHQAANVSRPTPAATAPTFVKNDAPADENVSRPANSNDHEAAPVYTGNLAKLGKNKYPAPWCSLLAAYTRANQYEVDGILQKLALPQDTRPEHVVDAINKYLDAKVAA